MQNMSPEETPITKKELADFSDFLLQKLNTHKSEIQVSFTLAKENADDALLASKRRSEDTDLKFNKSGNERNFKFNLDVQLLLEKALKALEQDNNTAV